MNSDAIEYLAPEQLGGLNLYAYCNNNPITAVDYTGTAWWNPFSWDWKGIGEGIKNFFTDTFGAGIVQSQTYKSMEATTFLGGYETGNTTSKVSCGDISKPISVYAKNASEWWKFWEYKVGIQINLIKVDLILKLTF